MMFTFIAKHRGIWPVEWLCGALGVSRGGFYAWLTRPRSRRSHSDEELGAKVRASFIASDRNYGARRVWHDMIADGVSCGLHRIERLMRLQALKARPRRRRLPSDPGERQASAVAPNVLDRAFEAPAPNRKWIADFTYIWTAEGWLYVAAVIDLFSRRVVGWSMSATMTAQFGMTHRVQQSSPRDTRAVGWITRPETGARTWNRWPRSRLPMDEGLLSNGHPDIRCSISSSVLGVETGATTMTTSRGVVRVPLTARYCLQARTRLVCCPRCQSRRRETADADELPHTATGRGADIYTTSF